MRSSSWRVGAIMVAAAVALWAWQEPAMAADKPIPPPPPLKEPNKGPRAVIKTKHGEIEIRFFPDLAPKHVENFVKLAKEGVYDGTIFHRVIPGFMIQGGDPLTKDPRKKEEYGTGGPLDKDGKPLRVKAEFNETPHKRGIVSMARSNDPDSAGSQFFIVVEDSRFLDRKYTAFGEVIRGMGVADKIVNEPRDEKDNPKTRIDMTVKILE
jgi:peptidyl-prolyl cis-trans isomerase B (cyclophilin B)